MTKKDGWKDRREFAVWANAPDGSRHRYCLPTDYRQAERVARELRHNGRTNVEIRDFNAVDDLARACRAAKEFIQNNARHVKIAQPVLGQLRDALRKVQAFTE
jgi:hypothetical protein